MRQTLLTLLPDIQCRLCPDASLRSDLDLLDFPPTAGALRREWLTGGRTC